MKRNIGKCDRSMRFVLGLGIVAAGIYFKSWYGLIGIIPIATALIRWCPLYLPFSKNGTCSPDNKTCGCKD